jgi:hypothetical protein
MSGAALASAGHGAAGGYGLGVTTRHPLAAILVLVCLCCAGCGGDPPPAPPEPAKPAEPAEPAEPAKAVEPAKEPRPETRKIEAAGAAGYNGKTIRRSVDKVLDKNDQRNAEIEKAAQQEP